VLVQDFLPEIADGELSLVFLGGEYSHSVVKKAAPGEFRIHIEYGGTVETSKPEAGLVERAEAALRALPMRALYARVDGVVRGRDLWIMEVEVLDPELFFDHDERAAAHFADLVCATLGL